MANLREIIINAEASGLDEIEVNRKVVNVVDEAIQKWLVTKEGTITDLTQYVIPTKDDNEFYNNTSFSYKTRHYFLNDEHTKSTSYHVNIDCSDFDESYQYPILSIYAYPADGYLTEHFVGIDEDSEEYFRSIKAVHLANSGMTVGHLSYSHNMNTIVATYELNTENIILSNDLFDTLESIVVNELRANADFFRLIFEEHKEPTENLFYDTLKTIYLGTVEEEEERKKNNEQ